MSSSAKKVVNAAAPVVKRDVNKWLYAIRQFLMLRDFTPNQRHEYEMAKRTQPQPHLPGGFAHKLNKNYYLDRDARRQVGQPQVLFSTTATNQLLASVAAQPQITAGAAGQPQPATPAAAGATGQQQPATPAATAPISQFVSIAEAEKLTAAALAAINTKGPKTLTQPRTPGKVYNWDG